MPQLLSDTVALVGFIHAHPMCAVYFSAPGCAVCKALKPKLIYMLAERFPEIALGEVDCALSPATAAEYSVFTIPTLTVFTLGKESLRKSRSFGLAGLASELERPYSLVFDDL
jgi:thiol-disulfide isomerase/thioredoxin